MWLIKAISISCEYRPMSKHPENHCIHVNYFVRALVKSQSRSRFHFIRSYKMLKLYQIDVNESWIFHVKHRTHRTLSAFQSFISIVLRTQRPGLFNTFSHSQCIDTVFHVAKMWIAERFYPYYSTLHTHICMYIQKKPKIEFWLCNAFNCNPFYGLCNEPTSKQMKESKSNSRFGIPHVDVNVHFHFPIPHIFHVIASILLYLQQISACALQLMYI